MKIQDSLKRPDYEQNASTSLCIKRSEQPRRRTLALPRSHLPAAPRRATRRATIPGKATVCITVTVARISPPRKLTVLFVCSVTTQVLGSSISADILLVVHDNSLVGGKRSSDGHKEKGGKKKNILEVLKMSERDRVVVSEIICARIIDGQATRRASSSKAMHQSSIACVPLNKHT